MPARRQEVGDAREEHGTLRLEYQQGFDTEPLTSPNLKRPSLPMEIVR